MRPLHALLGQLSEQSVLRSACEELARSRRFIDFAYLHNNGFFVVYLTDPNSGLQTRLHIWAPAHPPRREQPHRHRMGFVSRVLRGTLRSTMFELVQVDGVPGDDTELFREMQVKGPAHASFDVRRTTLVPGPVVGLRPTQRLVHRTGESYVFSAAGIHRVDSVDELREPVITLSVWEPAFQPSIAYEPLHSTSEARAMDVTRLNGALYRELLALVLDSLDGFA